MLELRYFKELPCRLLNKNTAYVQLAGADLYTDKEGNRYAFVSVKNNYRKPLFSLYLYIKEYDSTGTFLRDNKFSVPTFYGETGINVINEPIAVDKSCDGIEVFIYFAEYVGFNFYNDVFSKAGRERINLSISSVKTQVKAASNAVKGGFQTTETATPSDAASVSKKTRETVSYEEPVVDDRDEENEEETQDVVAADVKVIPTKRNSLGIVLGCVGIAFFLILMVTIIIFVLLRR